MDSTDMYGNVWYGYTVGLGMFFPMNECIGIKV